jgi:hypothetical protein
MSGIENMNGIGKTKRDFQSPPAHARMQMPWNGEWLYKTILERLL